MLLYSPVTFTHAPRVSIFIIFGKLKWEFRFFACFTCTYLESRIQLRYVAVLIHICNNVHITFRQLGGLALCTNDVYTTITAALYSIPHTSEPLRLLVLCLSSSLFTVTQKKYIGCIYIRGYLDLYIKGDLLISNELKKSCSVWFCGIEKLKRASVNLTTGGGFYRPPDILIVDQEMWGTTLISVLPPCNLVELYTAIRLHNWCLLEWPSPSTYIARNPNNNTTNQILTTDVMHLLLANAHSSALNTGPAGKIHTNHHEQGRVWTRVWNFSGFIVRNVIYDSLISPMFEPLGLLC